MSEDTNDVPVHLVNARTLSTISPSAVSGSRLDPIRRRAVPSRAMRAQFRFLTEELVPAVPAAAPDPAPALIAGLPDAAEPSGRGRACLVPGSTGSECVSRTACNRW